MRFASEDHFQHEISKRLTRAGVEHQREWVHWVEFSTKRRLTVRADILATKGVSAERCVQAWIEAKLEPGMHELATAIGQIRLSRHLHKNGPTVSQREYIVVPQRFYQNNPEIIHMLEMEGITCAHEDSIASLVKAELEIQERQYLKAIQAIRGSIKLAA